MQSNGPLVMQFAKFPILGEVKTRLAKELGDKKALEVHLKLVQQVSHNLLSSQQTDFELWLAGVPSMEAARAKFSFLPRQTCMRTQKGTDLGERMANALQDSLKDRPMAMVVGSDCPTVDAVYISEAVNVLKTHDLVFIPSEDGGYVLVGASRFDPTLFDDIQWGTSDVLKRTLANAKQLEFSFKCLRPTWDVDEIDDYERWLRQTGEGQ